MKITAIEISEYFRESVSFDFDREDIISYQQIENDFENFYALVVKDAFIALLNDAIGYDNQLIDIFSDLFDAELGIQKFANKDARNIPRQFIAYFLNLPKYQYHKSDIGKVYIAVNTWLLFFGEDEINPNWARCPFCGGTVINGICANKSCMRTTNDCMTALSELTSIFEAEKNGQNTATPKYWDDIKPGYEFYFNYKSPIELVRKCRDKERLADEEKIKKEILEQAEKIYNSYIIKLEFESEKSEPDFDALLCDFMNESYILSATQYNDRSFKRKINNLTTKIKNEKNKQEQNKAISAFIEAATQLKFEIEQHSRNLPILKGLFSNADFAYEKIIALFEKGLSYPSTSIEREIEEWGKCNRDIVSKLISDIEERELLLLQQNSLQKRVDRLLNELADLNHENIKIDYYRKRFEVEIENNIEYSLIRIQYVSQYDGIILPLKDKLQELTRLEKERKISNFLVEAETLLSLISVCRPQKKRYSILEKQFKEISARYCDIQRCSEYKNRASEIQSKLLQLFKNEQKWSEKRKNRIISISKITRIMSVVVMVAILISFGAVFLVNIVNIVNTGSYERLSDNSLYILSNGLSQLTNCFSTTITNAIQQIGNKFFAAECSAVFNQIAQRFIMFGNNFLVVFSLWGQHFVEMFVLVENIIAAIARKYNN